MSDADGHLEKDIPGSIHRYMRRYAIPVARMLAFGGRDGQRRFVLPT